LKQAAQDRSGFVPARGDRIMGDVSLQTMPKGITAEDVWAMFKESDRKFREMSAEADRRQKESDRKFREMSAEADRRQKEVDRQMKETQRIVGDLGNRFGDIAEQLLTPGLEGKFEKFGLFFEKLSRNVKWKNKGLDFLMEFDALLENDRQAMIVEVKSKLTAAAVDEQAKRMEKLRRYADKRGERRQFFCAMAALTAPDNIINYTLANGFYLIMPSGEDVKITAPVPGPVVW
jgi:hypothetical protein